MAGICAVHARYETPNKSEFDFLNMSPNQPRVLTGTGYFYKFNDNCFVVTCNHVVVKNAAYYAYYKVDDKIIELPLKPTIQLYELDVAVLSFAMPEIELPFLSWTASLNESYADENHMITAFYKQGDLEYKKTDINENVSLTHSMVNCCAVMDIPIYTFDWNEADSQKYTGSIVKSGDAALSLVLMQSEPVKKNKYMKTLPLHLIDVIFRSMMKTALCRLVGINIVSVGTTFEHDGVEMNGHIVINKSRKYETINTKKDFYFNVDNIIIQVDKKKFVKGELYCDLLNCYVKLNCYLMLKSIARGRIEFTILTQNTNGVVAKKTVILQPIKYENIYICPPTTNGNYINWNGMIFMEFSEEIYDFYAYHNKPLGELVDKFIGYASTNERCVILLNHIDILKGCDQLHQIDHILQNIDQLPHKDDETYFFFQVDKLCNKKINNLHDLRHILDKTIKKMKQITFTLTRLDKATESIKLRIVK